MRRFLFALLILSVLLRSTASVAMHLIPAPHLALSAASAIEVPSEAHEGCHTSPLQTSSNSVGENASDMHSCTACEVCCAAATLPSTAIFSFSTPAHSAPTAALFASLPASQQRPQKPPLV